MTSKLPKTTPNNRMVITHQYIRISKSSATAVVDRTYSYGAQVFRKKIRYERRVSPILRTSIDI